MDRERAHRQGAGQTLAPDLALQVVLVGSYYWTVCDAAAAPLHI